ncbi:MAG: HAMP domain-containing histidine kinase [Clostridia bacterium]|nr:HAMP domain-containing histidine kinase [Clostridia bacterium]
MINKIRLRFILISFLAVFIVLSLIISAINISNYSNIVRNKDNLIHMLADNGGQFPASIPKSESPFQPGSESESMRRRNESELPFETRYFSIQYDNAGTILSCDLENIAAISSADAEGLADTALNKTSSSGFIKDYRYIKHKTNEGLLIVFLDCSRDLSIFRSSLLSSVLVSAGGLLAVAVLILLLSKRAVRPISESYNRQKQFITDAGHEIKTPLTIINADIDVLELENDLTGNEWINDIRNQTRRMTELTNELIFLSKTEEFSSTGAFSANDISVIFEKAIDSFHSRALLKDQEFKTNIASGITFICDYNEMERLFEILLDNAIKYAPVKSTIECSLAVSGKQVVIAVNNELPVGVSCDPLKLFDRFYRADSSRNSENGGFGLGLSIAQAIVQHHKGSIRAGLPDENMLSIMIHFPK